MREGKEKERCFRICPGALAGTVQAVPSKSDAHRALIAAALADGPTVLLFDGTSRDIEATLACLQALGAKIRRRDGGVEVTPLWERQDSPEPADSPVPFLDCGESGSTLRFLLPVAAALYRQAEFTGRPGLAARPLGELQKALEKGGAGFSASRLPLRVTGPLRSGVYELPGNVSSQYVSGLLFALPLLEKDSLLRLTSPLESAGYVEMTLRTLRTFSVGIEEIPGGYRIPGRQSYRSPGQLLIEGDWSNAAFFLAAGALGQGVAVEGLQPDSLQRDRLIAGLLEEFGAKVEWREKRLLAAGGRLSGIRIDAGQIPDLVPILAVVAAYAKGRTEIRNAGRLRLKESDRLATVAAMLKGLGAAVEELPQGLVITGRGELTGGRADSANDHRIAMAAAVAAAYARGPSELADPWAVCKSYPGFYEDFKSLGGNVDVF